MKKITLLGATGSIGESALQVMARAGAQLQAVSANKNAQALAQIAKKFNAAHAVVADENYYKELKTHLDGTDIKVSAGAQALEEAATEPADGVIAAITGIAGLGSVFAAARTQKRLALANKEAVVCGGTLLMATARAHGCEILPIDSEHHALSRLLDKARAVRRVTLTASGGAFRDLPLSQMKDITPAQAVTHPVWSMGDKISVDSSTMMNKVLEVIEAHYLFDLPAEQLGMVQHRESIVHALVEEASGAQCAFLSNPDMKLAIADVLSEVWGNQRDVVAPLDIAQLGQLTFEPLDPARFPAVRLLAPVLAEGQGAAIILNAANEILVKAFLQGEISYPSIVAGVESVLEEMNRHYQALETLADISALKRGGTSNHKGKKEDFMTEYLMTILSYALPFLFVFTVVVFIHELGHFLVARWNGVFC